jgi:hypothetical protein
MVLEKGFFGWEREKSTHSHQDTQTSHHHRGRNAFGRVGAADRCGGVFDERHASGAWSGSHNQWCAIAAPAGPSPVASTSPTAPAIWTTTPATGASCTGTKATKAATHFVWAESIGFKTNPRLNQNI